MHPSMTFGEVTLERDGRPLRGDLVLTEHKLFLRKGGVDLASTYIPLEKIVGVRRRWGRVTLDVRPSPVTRYTVRIRGTAGRMADLVAALVRRRGLRRKGWFGGWRDSTSV